ncbi:MAG: alpha/beta hydrolase [Stagnimonas sp.]|nr:alpha/beta hydrolase [Stagnimonas sp.]
MVKKGLLSLLIVVLVLLAGIAGFTQMAPAKATALAIHAERRASGLSEQMVTVGGYQWHLLTGGPVNDPTPLVLIHGFGGDKDNWTRVVRGLTKTQRVIIPDLPGFGDSDKPDIQAGYTIPEQMGRLHSLLSELGIKRFYLGGNSMGGWIASAYAKAFPEEVIGVWLLAPAGIAGAQKSEMTEHLEQGGRLPLVVRNRTEFDERLGWVFVNTPPLPGFVRETLSARAAANADLHELIRQRLYGISPSQEELLGAPIAMPALIVWGEQDRVLHPSGADILAPYYNSNGTTVIKLPAVGHLPMTEQPERCAADYLTWRAVLERWNIGK